MTMGRRRGSEPIEPTIEELVISDYVRLCTEEGLKPGEAYRKVKRRLKKTATEKNQKIVAVHRRSN
jgi:hypothetical protein